MAQQKLTIPIRGLYNRDHLKISPTAKRGYCQTLDNWLVKEGVYSQVNGNASIIAATAVHSMLYFRKADGTGHIAYTDGRGLYTVTLAGSGATVNATEFATSPGTLRWPCDRFRGYLLFGSVHDGLHWYTPAGVGSGPTYSGKAGLTAPTGAPVLGTGAGTGLTGIYKGVYTYINVNGNESNPSPLGTSATLANQSLAWTGIAVGPAGTTKRKVYRTVANGGIYLYLTTINDNTTTTYADSTIDAGLGTEVEIDNDAPPTNIAGMCVAGARLYLLDGSDRLTIWACKIDPDTSLPNWEAFPSSLCSKIPIGEPADGVQNIFNINEVLFAATRTRLFKLMGDPYTGQPIYKVFDVGFFNPWSWCYVGKSIYFLSSTMRVMRFDGEAVEDVSDQVTGIIRSITNNVVPDLTDSVSFCYNPTLNIIVVNYAATGTSNNKTLVFDVASKEWSQNDWPYREAIIDDTGQYQVGHVKGVDLVKLDTTLFYKSSTTYFTRQLIQTTPFHLPDGDTFVGRIGLTVKALPVVSYVPPMLLVEYAVDGDETHWKPKYVDLSLDYMKWMRKAATGVVQDRTTVFVPVFKTVGSISVKITAPQNAAALQGFEIYDLFLEVEQRVRGRSEDRDPESDRVELEWK
jgi:hypothetical protein